MSHKKHTDNCVGAILEDVNHKFDVIVEYLAPLASLPGDVAQLKDDMSAVKGRLTNVEFAVKDLSGQVADLSKQVRQVSGASAS